MYAPNENLASLEAKILRRMELEEQLPQLETKEQELREQALRLKYELREAEMALMGLEGTGIGNLLRRVMGKQEQAQEAKRREVRDLKAAAQQTAMELSRTEASLRSGRQELETLADCYAQYEQALDGSGQLAEDIRRHKCRLHLRQGIHAARQILTALENGRDMSRRVDPGRSRAWLAREETRAFSLAEEHAAKLSEHLTALSELGEAFPSCPYLSNPAAYLATASDYTQLDRVNQAMDQILSIRRQMEQRLTALS